MEESLFNLLKEDLQQEIPAIQVLNYFSELERESSYIAIGISPLGALAPGVPFYKAALVVQAGVNRQEESLAAEKVRLLLEKVKNILTVPRKGTVLSTYTLDGIIPDGNAGTIGPDENDRFIAGEITYTVFSTKQ